MKIALPYSRDRRYLNGTDWIIGTLDHIARRRTGIGSLSQIVLDLEGRLDEKPLRDALNQISQQIPLIHGRVARDWLNLAPYWKAPREPLEIPLRVIELASDATSAADRLLDNHVNTPLRSESRHLSFLLLHLSDNRSRLGMVFDHRLFDAFGAEAFLRLIDETAKAKLPEISPRVQQTEPPQLDNWQQQFASGRKLNQLIAQTAKRDVCALTMPPAKESRRMCFVHESLSANETSRFEQKSMEEAGVPIVLPSASARAIRAIRNIFPDMPLTGSQYLLFTSGNNRLPAEEWESLLFNRFSFLLLSAGIETTRSIADLTNQMRDQLFERMADGSAAAMQQASLLLRICPHSVLSRLMPLLFKGRMCTAYFVCLKECGYPSDTFLSLRVADLIHMPQAFCPPGLNLCMTWFGSRFHLVLSYAQGVMDELTAKRLMREFKQLLLN